MLDRVESLTNAQESRRSYLWQVSDASAAVIDKMLKVSQDETMPDRLGTVYCLRFARSAEPRSASVGNLGSQAIDTDTQPGA